MVLTLLAACAVIAGIIIGNQISARVRGPSPLEQLLSSVWFPADTCRSEAPRGSALAVVDCRVRAGQVRSYLYPSLQDVNARFRAQRRAVRIPRRACRRGGALKWYTSRAAPPAGRLLSWRANAKANIVWTQARSRVYNRMSIAGTLPAACRMWRSLSRKP